MQCVCGHERTEHKRRMDGGSALICFHVVANGRHYYCPCMRFSAEPDHCAICTSEATVQTADGRWICKTCAAIALQVAIDTMPIYVLAATETDAAAFAARHRLSQWAFVINRDGAMTRWPRGTVKYVVVPGFHRRSDVTEILSMLGAIAAVEVDPLDYQGDADPDRAMRVTE